MDFLVNGQAQELPLADDGVFSALIQHAFGRINSERQLISGIRVNGLEISQSDEQALAEVPLSTLQSVEILTQNPREMAESTLQALFQFIPILQSQLAEAAAEIIPDSPLSTAFHDRFEKLIDGVRVMQESIVACQRILGATEGLPLIRELESVLLSALQEVFARLTAQDAAGLQTALREPLAKALARWLDEGAPALIRCRDN